MKLPHLILPSVLLILSPHVVDAASTSNLISSITSRADSLYTVITSLPDDTIKVNMINEHGIYILNENYDRGLELANKALSISDKLGFEKGKTGARYNIGNYYWYNGFYDKAEYYFQEALRSAKKSNNLSITASINNRIGLVHYYQAHYYEADAYHRKALDNYTDINDTLGVAMVNYHIGLLYYHQCEYESAVDYYVKSLKLYESVGASLNQASLLNRLSQVYLDVGQPELVWERKEDLLNLANTNDAQSNIAEFHERIGDIFFLLDEYDSAFNRFQLAAEEFEASGRMNAYDFVIEKIGKIYLSKNNFEAALDLFMKVDMIREQQGTRIHVSSSAGNLGDLFKKKKDWQNALKYYQKSLSMHLEMNNALSATKMHTNIAEVYLALGNAKMAIEHAQNGLQKAISISAKNLEIANLELLGDAYFTLQDYPQAFTFLKRHHERKNELFEGNMLQKIENLRVSYYDEKNQREVAQLKQMEIQKDAELQQRTLLVIIFSILLIFTCIIILLLYSRNKLKNRNNELLSRKNELLHKKNKEGEILLHEIRHRIKNNLQTISSLLNLHSRQLSDHQKLLIKESNDRLTAIALVHEKLQQDTGYSLITLDLYLKELADNLIFSYNTTNLDVQYDLEPIAVEANSAVYLGLIVNELVSNSLKHAFKEHLSPKIYLKIRTTEEELIQLQVKDNGNGFKNSDSGPESFGLELISMLVEELGGNINYQNGQGTTVTISFKHEQLKAVEDAL